MVAFLVPELNHALNPHSLTSSSTLICKCHVALFANEGGIISPEHLATTTVVHVYNPKSCFLLSFEALLAIIRPPLSLCCETLVGGGASTTSTVFGLLEHGQGLGSQWSMEAKQSPRPRAESEERSLGEDLSAFKEVREPSQLESTLRGNAETRADRSWRKRGPVTCIYSNKTMSNQVHISLSTDMGERWN